MAAVCFCTQFATASIHSATGFRDEQQEYPRVRTARQNTETALNSLYTAAGLKRDSAKIFLRILKHERILEVWAGEEVSDSLRLLASFGMTAYCGRLGPKRAQGDFQIPEGIYHIDRFNPASSYHLSLGINYPNKSDRKRTTASHPGGDIFIHGSAVTIGCVPIGNAAIEQLYIMAVDARNAGQERIPVHIFPCRMNSDKNQQMLKLLSEDYGPPMALWNELTAVYKAFEKGRRLPKVEIDRNGSYSVSDIP